MREWENNVRKVVPYTPGEQPQDQRVIKLNTNENPYPPSPTPIHPLRDSCRRRGNGRGRNSVFIRIHLRRFWWMRSRHIMGCSRNRFS